MLIPPRNAMPAKIKITNQTLALVVNCPMIYKNIKLFNIDYKINYDTQPKKQIGTNIIPCSAAQGL
jgi:homoserine trans-succinylase